MADGREFDIYQTAAGYAAVTNPTRRKILSALEKEDLELGALVKITEKSKPTLSNLHMRELLDQNLIEERPHATDARRKIYRLVARRIGSSNVPLEQLRGAVKHYVSLSPLAFAVPLPAVLEVLVSDKDAPPAVLRKQARELGQKASSLFTTSSARDVLTAVAGFWERENVARTVGLRFDRLELEVQLLGPLAERPVACVGHVLAGLIEGILSARLSEETDVKAKPGKGGRLTLTLG